MANPNPLDLQQLSELVQASMEAVAELHEVLYVIHSGEIHVYQIKEPNLRIGQILTR